MISMKRKAIFYGHSEFPIGPHDLPDDGRDHADRKFLIG